MTQQLRQLKGRWQPASNDDDFYIPTMGQQRADARILLFLGKNIDLTTEVIIHVRGDGTTFDDGTPLTNNTVGQHLTHQNRHAATTALDPAAAAWPNSSSLGRKR